MASTSETLYESESHEDNARDRAVTFLMVAAVGGSGAVFLVFTLPSLVMTGGRVFLCLVRSYLLFLKNGSTVTYLNMVCCQPKLHSCLVKGIVEVPSREQIISEREVGEREN